jgi:hypothetical protein
LLLRARESKSGARLVGLEAELFRSVERARIVQPDQFDISS